MTIKAYATSVTYSPGTNQDENNGGHHKSWYQKENLTLSNGIAYCSNPDGEYPTIAGVNGTFHTPSPLDLTGFNFDFGSEDNVKSVIVHFKQQTFENNWYTVNINSPTITLLGVGTSKAASGKVTTTLTEQKVTFNNITKSQLLNNNFGVRIVYPQNTATTPGRIILQDVYVEVIMGTSISKYPSTVEYAEECGGNTNYKCWDNLSNLKASGGTAYCRNPNSTDTPTIAGKNGTYNQPAPIRLKDFNFDLDNDAAIEKVVVHYSQQKFINNGYYPEIGGATVSLLGTSLNSQTGSAVSSTLLETSVTFTGVTVNQINSSNFGVKIAYPSNTSTTPGRIIIKDTYVEVFTSESATKISLQSNFSSNPIIVGESTDLTLLAKKTSDAACTANIIVDLPLGVTVGNITCNDTVTKNTVSYTGNEYTRLIWNPSFVRGTVSTTLTTTLTATRANESYTGLSDNTRPSLLSMVETKTNITSKNYLIITGPIISLTSSLYSDKVSLPPNESTRFTIHVTTKDPSRTDKELRFAFDYPIEIVNASEISALTMITSASITNNRNVTIQFKDNGNTNLFIPVEIISSEGGTYDAYYNIREVGATSILKSLHTSFTVRPTTLGKLGFTRCLVDEKFTQNMENGIEYTLGAMCKYSLTNENYNVEDYDTNFRIGIFNNSTEYVDSETAFLQHVTWSKMATNKYKELTTTFTYNSDYPLYFVYSQTFMGDLCTPFTAFNFSEVRLVESSNYDYVTKRENAVVPVKALLADTDYATANLTTTGNNSTTQAAITYDWIDGGIFNEDITPLSITFYFDYIVDQTVLADVYLYLDNEHQGHRSVLLRSKNGTAVIGNSYDLFGLDMGDFIGKINQLEMRLILRNTYEKDCKVQINNVRMKISYVHQIKCGYGFTVDGVHSKMLGIVVSEIETPFATQNESSDYHVTGTDTTIINRLNVDTKEISFTIQVNSCTISESMPLVDKIVELFTNNRELNSNRPILKTLVFDHMPERRFLFVREDEFDDEWVGSTYKAKIKLLIPDGSTYDVNETMTGAEGYVPQTIAIKPVITVKAGTSGVLSFTETCLGQSMTIKSKYITKGDTIVINTDERTVHNETEEVDLTGEVDYYSMWPRLKGEYSFESDNCSIQSITYYLRR